MKQVIITILIIVAGIYSCKKTDSFLYRSSGDSVYFNFDPKTTLRDSVLFTFAEQPGVLKDTVFLPVSISGIRVNKERKFSVMVVQDGGTAVANTHYEPFKEFYSIPADSGQFNLPVILYNKDPLLTERSIVLKLKLVPSTDLDTANNKLINAKIVFSNKLEQPIWWNMWLGSYYSQIKHRLFIIAAGVTELTTVGLDAPRNLYYVSKLTNLLNDPFTWVTSNPAKGYELTKRADGNYDFYSKENPASKILLRKNESAGKFYFIDENGKEII
jgi:hypothetical protein